MSSTENPFAFLSPAATSGAVLRTPMERHHLSAGATLEQHDGWRIAVYEPCNGLEAWAADVSHIGKLDVRGRASSRGRRRWSCRGRARSGRARGSAVVS